MTNETNENKQLMVQEKEEDWIDLMDQSENTFGLMPLELNLDIRKDINFDVDLGLSRMTKAIDSLKLNLFGDDD